MVGVILQLPLRRQVKLFGREPPHGQPLIPQHPHNRQYTARNIPQLRLPKRRRAAMHVFPLNDVAQPEVVEAVVAVEHELAVADELC